MSDDGTLSRELLNLNVPLKIIDELELKFELNERRNKEAFNQIIGELI